MTDNGHFSYEILETTIFYQCVRGLMNGLITYFYRMTVILQLCSKCCVHFWSTQWLAQSAHELKVDRPHPCNYSTHRQTPWTDNESCLLCAALGKAEPLISTAARRKFDQTEELGQTDGQTGGRTLPSVLSPCFAKATRSIKTLHEASKDTASKNEVMMNSQKFVVFFVIWYRLWLDLT